MLLVEFFEAVFGDVESAAREVASQILEEAKTAHKRDVHVPIMGEALKVEGAANLSPTVMAPKSVRLKTQGYISESAKGPLAIELKRGFFDKTPEITVDIEFERAEQLESIEKIRDHANEANFHHRGIHRATLAKSGVNVLTTDGKEIRDLVSFQKENQAAQYEFWASGNAAYVSWSSDAARAEWVAKVKKWKEYADEHDGVFEDGSTLTQE